MKRKLTCIIAVFSMLLAMMPTNVFADVSTETTKVSVVDGASDAGTTSEALKTSDSSANSDVEDKEMDSVQPTESKQNEDIDISSREQKKQTDEKSDDELSVADTKEEKSPIVTWTETGKTYDTIQEAINAVTAAGDEGTVILNSDSTENVVIPEGKKITITIAAGVTLSGKSTHTILNRGELVVNGNGDIINNVKGGAAIANVPGADAQLDGCTLSGNTWYVVKNLGSMQINGAVIVQNDAGSSAIDNGFYGSKGGDLGYSESDYADGSVKLTIKDGSVSGGINAVKNDDLAVLTIDGGNFTNNVPGSAVIMNWNNLEINGGTFTQTAQSGCVITNGSFGIAADKGEAKITAGTFVSGNGNGALFGLNGSAINAGKLDITGGTFTGITESAYVNENSGYTINISGGTFSSEIPAMYLAEGFVPKKNADGTYGACNHPVTEIKDAKEATCIDDGYTGDTYCTECGAKVKEGTVIRAKGHSYAETYSSDETSHWYECTVCGDKKDLAEHSFKTIVDKEPTSTEAGSKHEECTVCGYKKSAEVIPAKAVTKKDTEITNKEAQIMNKTDGPATGDNSDAAMYGIIALAAGLSAVAAVIARKKRKI